MRKRFRKYLIPHEDNDHQPHMLRGGTTKKLVALICLVELVILLLILPSRPDSITEKVHDLAAVFPSVLVEKTNRVRLAEAKPELAVSEVLTLAAQLKADDMAQKGYFAHTSPEGKTPWHWLQTAGYKYQTAGENLAVNFVDSSDVHNAWLNSPTHRANIVRDGFTEIGIATAEGTYKGKKAIFVAQFFAAPSKVSDTLAQRSTVAVSNLTPTVPATTSEPSLQTEVLGADVVVEQEVFTTTGVVQTGATESLETVQSLSVLQEAASSPRTMLGSVLLVLATLIVLALVLKIFVKVRVQYPKLILNGILILLLIYGFTVLNQYVIGLFAEIV
jgi:hypothetical protein